MNHIPPWSLWIGNARDVRDALLITDAEIECVVQLAIEEPSPTLPRDLCFIRIPLPDGEGNDSVSLRLAVQTVGQLLLAGRPTLIGCSAGLSRSPAVAACALALVHGRSPADQLRTIAATAPADVSPVLWRELLAVHSSLVVG